MTDVPPTKTNGTSGTSGTTLIIKQNSGPAADNGNWTNGTTSAAPGPAAPAVVPLVPSPDKRTGPQKTNNFNAVPLVPLVPPENGSNSPDLFAAFEAIFAALETRETVSEPEDDDGEHFETTDTTAAALAPDLDDFAERAAIREFDGGEDRAAAEHAAAVEQGYSNPAALYAAATRYWRRKLEVFAAMFLLDGSLDICGQARITNALRFVDEGGAERALALGWPELELFGVDPQAPWECLDRMGAAYRAGPVMSISTSKIDYLGNPTLWIAQQADGAVWPWEIPPGQPDELQTLGLGCGE